MKRLLTLLAVLLTALCISPLFASTYTDSFSFLSTYDGYIELYDAINNYASASDIDTLYESLKASLGNTSQDWTVLLKASLNYAHYLLEMAEKKNTKKAKQLISNAEAIYKALEKSGLKETSNLSALKFTCLSIGYLASPLSVSKGLESIKVIDSAYEEYPNELSIAVLYASRKLNAPSIGGGDVDEAYSVYCSLLAFIETEDGANTSPWERFDIYCGIAKCYEKKDDNNEALKMYQLALSIYPQNKTVVAAVEKLGKN